MEVGEEGDYIPVTSRPRELGVHRGACHVVSRPQVV